MRTSRPLVTVAIPMYQAQETIGRSLRSLRFQTFQDFEVLILDDGSTDGSLGVAKAHEIPRMRIIKNEKNEGLAASRNVLLMEAQGKYIAWLDADDWSLSERLQIQVTRMESNKNLVISSGWSYIMNGLESVKASTRPWQLSTNVLRGANLYTTPTDRNKLRLGQGFFNYIQTSTCVIRRDVAVRNGLKFRANWSPAEDYGMWNDLLGYGDLCIERNPLSVINVLSTGASARERRRQIQAASEIGFMYLRQNLGLGLDESDWLAHQILTQDDRAIDSIEKFNLTLNYITKVLLIFFEKSNGDKQTVNYWRTILTQRLLHKSSSWLSPASLLTQISKRVLWPNPNVTWQLLRWRLFPKHAP